jgi:predicted alpha/beta-hydrolase family hydrolase
LSVTRLEVPTSHGQAEVELTRPRNARALVVLTHGAGGRPDTADIAAAADAALAVPAAVALVTQPYRVAGRSTPPTAGPQDAAWTDVVAALRSRRGLGSVPLVLGGRSNGARVACRTALACGAAGVLALSFPVHPPGKPEKSRLDELAGAAVPVLVLQGDRDPFGRPPAAPGRDVILLPGDGHSPTRNLATITAATARFLAGLLG